MYTHREALALAIYYLKEAEKDGDYVFDGMSVPEEDKVIARLTRYLEAPDALAVAARDLCSRLLDMGYGATSDKSLPGEFDTVLDLLKQRS